MGLARSSRPGEDPFELQLDGRMAVLEEGEDVECICSRKGSVGCDECSKETEEPGDEVKACQDGC